VAVVDAVDTWLATYPGSPVVLGEFAAAFL
jgi:hypothetical protein